MLCNLCNKNLATVHLTEIVDNQMSELHLCDECARKKSMQMEQQFGLSDLLAGLVDYGKQFPGMEKPSTVVQCSNCGLTYEDFKKVGRLGCSECYVTFSNQLIPLLKRIHGADHHVGKAPLKYTEPPARGQTLKAQRKKAPILTVNISELKQKLQKAIEREEFEEAASLRDAIRAAEKKEHEKKKKGSSKKDET